MIAAFFLVAHSFSITYGDFNQRIRRQIPKDIKQGCETTGYEKRVREVCEEVLEKVCKVGANDSDTKKQ